MIKFIEESRPGNAELRFYHCGMQRCSPSHSYGPAVRDHFLIHYITNGSGIFEVNGTKYNLSKGDAFLICPGMKTYYEASIDNPWTYLWVGFNGYMSQVYLSQACISQDNPIVHYDMDDFLESCIIQMIDTRNMRNGKELRLMGLLYVFLSKLIEVSGGSAAQNNYEDLSKLYALKAVEYMEMNYSRNITIEEVSKYIGIARSHLFMSFKKQLNVSPSKYLINLRMEKACELIAGNNCSIGDVSRSVGYEDPLLFSKMFKKVKGLPPNEYRKKLST